MTEKEDFPVTSIYTGKKTKMPLPKTIEEPDCPVALMSYKVFRSALEKMFALAKATYKNKGGIEAYCIMLSNRDDLAVTEILIPEQTATGGNVTVEPEAINDLRRKIKEMNASAPEGSRWKAVGWSHSHGGMSVFFSGTDWQNQQRLLNSIGLITEHNGQKLMTVFGMTVNIRREIYAEIYNRMNCLAEVRQDGAKLNVIEDIDKDDPKIRDQIYNRVETEVLKKVTSPRDRYKKRPRIEYTTTAPRYPIHDDYSDMEQVSVDDVVKEVKEGVRSAGDVLYKAVKNIPVKKLLQPVGEMKLQQVLLKIVSESKNIILNDVERIVRGEEIDDDGDEREVREVKKKKRKKYEIVCDAVEEITDKKNFEDWNTFVEEIEEGIKPAYLTYLKSTPSFMNEKFEERGFSFDGVVEKDKKVTDNGKINGYFQYLISKVKLPVKLAGDIRIKLYAGMEIEEIAEMKPKKFAKVIDIKKGQAENIINHARHFLKESANKKKCKMCGDTIENGKTEMCKLCVEIKEEIDKKEDDSKKNKSIEEIKEAMKKKRDEMKEEWDEYASYIRNNVTNIFDSDKANIVNYLERGCEISDFLTMDNKDMSKLLRSTTKTVRNAKEFTIHWLIMKKKMPVPMEYAFIYEIDMSPKIIKLLEKYIQDEEMPLNVFVGMSEEEVADILGCMMDDARLILSTAKDSIEDYEAKFNEEENEHWDIDYRYFIEPLMIHRETKDAMKKFLKRHASNQLLSLSIHELMMHFGCEDWEADLIAKTFIKLQRSRKNAIDKEKKDINGKKHYWNEKMKEWVEIGPIYPDEEIESSETDEDIIDESEDDDEYEEYIELIAEIELDLTTREILFAFLKNNNSLEDIVAMSEEEIREKFTCNDEYAKNIKEAIQDKLASTTTSWDDTQSYFT